MTSLWNGYSIICLLFPMAECLGEVFFIHYGSYLVYFITLKTQGFCQFREILFCYFYGNFNS